MRHRGDNRSPIAANKSQFDGFHLIHVNATQKNISQKLNGKVGIDRFAVRRN